MKITIDKNEKYSVLRVHEEKMDTLIAPDLKSELVKLNAEGVKNIIMDLTEVRYADSSGLSAILVGNRLSNSVNGIFIICSLQPNVKKLIDISQLDSVLNITKNEGEAIDLVFMDVLEKDLESE